MSQDGLPGNLALKILNFDEGSHMQALRACVIELQEFERALDPRMPAGKDIVDDYIDQLLHRCKSCQGQVLIAEVDGEVAGIVSILTKVSSGELQDGDIEYGLIPDLVILPGYRGTGIGRKLLAAAEAYAMNHQVKWLRIGAMSANQNAKELYLSSGYNELFVELEKNLCQEVPR